MPYVEHPVFIFPRSDDAQIWRYMSLSKFMNMIASSELYFASAKTIADLEWFEGRPTSLDKRFASYTWEDAPEKYKAAFGGSDREAFELLQRFQRDFVSNYTWEWLARTTSPTIACRRVRSSSPTMTQSSWAMRAWYVRDHDA
jgi:hypothetical protein